MQARGIKIAYICHILSIAIAEASVEGQREGQREGAGTRRRVAGSCRARDRAEQIVRPQPIVPSVLNHHHPASPGGKRDKMAPRRHGG